MMSRADRRIDQMAELTETVHIYRKQKKIFQRQKKLSETEEMEAETEETEAETV